jgi:hypothetical protein
MKPCHFKIKGTCALDRCFCILCTHRIASIDGISEMKDYINIVTTRNNSLNAMIIAIISLLISFLTLILKIYENPGNK